MWLLPGGLLLAVVWPRDRPVSVPARRDWPPVQRMWQPLRWGDKLGLWRWECLFLCCVHVTFRLYVSLCCIFLNNSGSLDRWLHQLSTNSSPCSALHLGHTTDRISKKPWEMKHDTAALCPFRNNPNLLSVGYWDEMLNVGQNDLWNVTFPANFVIFAVKMCHYLAAPLWFMPLNSLIWCESYVSVVLQQKQKSCVTLFVPLVELSISKCFMCHFLRLIQRDVNENNEPLLSCHGL